MPQTPAQQEAMRAIERKICAFCMGNMKSLIINQCSVIPRHSTQAGNQIVVSFSLKLYQTIRRAKVISMAVLGFALASPALSDELEPGGKLLLTRGTSSVDGAAGGGIVPWALIAGNETDRGIGATAHITTLNLPDYDFLTYGGAVGFFDRFELSVAHQEFDTGQTGPLLGLSEGFTFNQSVLGAKLRVLGDAVYDQDTWVPQVAIGGFYKSADHGELLDALGADRNESIELYATATKLVLDQSLLIGATLRYTDANQNGLLGFGGGGDHELHPEASLGYLINKRLVIGAEYRSKPDNLAFAKEDDWVDFFAAYAVNPNLTLTAAYADLGSIATFDEQRGLYLSLQLGY